MKLKRKDFLLFSKDSDISISGIRKELLNRLLILLQIFAIPTLIVAFIEGIQLDHSTYSPYIYLAGIAGILTAFFLRRALPFWGTVGIIIVVGFYISTVNLIHYGFSGAALQIFLILSIIVTILGGVRRGLVVLILSAIPMAIVGYLVTQGKLVVKQDIDFISLQPIAWVTSITVLVFLGGIVIIGFGIIEKNLLNSLRIVRSQTQDLELVNQELKEEIERVNGIRKELRAAKEKAELSDKLKSAFLRNISHEFRTPMNSIVGFSDLLLVNGIDTATKAIYTEMIKKNCNQLLDIVDDTVEIAKIETSELKITPEPYDICILMDEVCKKFQKDFDAKGIGFEKEVTLHRKPFLVMIDAFKVRRSLNHLVDNACKFTLKGKVSISATEKDGILLFEVKDTGIGIPDDVMDRIYKPFATEELTINKQFGGQGLGLSLVKAYTEGMKGQVTIESETDKGTSVKLEVPYKLFEIPEIKNGAIIS
jgi:signal transduction histidine kinase